MMKKITLFTVLASVTLFFASCKEEKEKALFRPFTSQFTFEVTIPVVTTTTKEESLDGISLRYNIDSVIKANTANQFDIKAVGAMYVNAVTVNLLDADDANNLGNFENVRMTASGGSVTTPVVLATANVPNEVVKDMTIPFPEKIDLKPLFTGSKVNFTLYGKARRPTTRDVKARISTTINFEK